MLDVPWHNIDYAIADLGPDKNGSWPYPDVPGTANPDAECNGEQLIHATRGKSRS